MDPGRRRSRKLCDTQWSWWLKLNKEQVSHQRISPIFLLLTYSILRNQRATDGLNFPRPAVINRRWLDSWLTVWTLSVIHIVNHDWWNRPNAHLLEWLFRFRFRFLSLSHSIHSVFPVFKLFICFFIKIVYRKWSTQIPSLTSLSTGVNFILFFCFCGLRGWSQASLHSPLCFAPGSDRSSRSEPACHTCILMSC